MGPPVPYHASVERDILRNQQLVRQAQENDRRSALRAENPWHPGNNLVNVAGHMMQVIEAGQLWQHYQEAGVQLRVTEEGGGVVTVAPVGLSAQVGLPNLFLLTVEVFTREFRHVPNPRPLQQGDRDHSEDVLGRLAAETPKMLEDDNVERRSIWERLMDEDDDTDELNGD